LVSISLFFPQKIGKSLHFPCINAECEYKNKEHRLVKKRRRGGGRKPSLFGKTATLTTRLEPETRQALDAAAAEHRPRPLTVSRMAELLLKAALLNKEPSGRHNNALAAAVERLAENIERGTNKSWRDDVFTGMALRYAIEHLLYHFAPTPDGDPLVPAAVNEAAAKMPEEFAQRFRKPAGFGHTLAFQLIHEIEQAMSPGPINEWSLPYFLSGPREQLALIARDLAVAKKKGKPK
jgi:hypothetical protein